MHGRRKPGPRTGSIAATLEIDQNFVFSAAEGDIVDISRQDSNQIPLTLADGVTTRASTRTATARSASR
jgi:hypothetical protein